MSADPLFQHTMLWMDKLFPIIERPRDIVEALLPDGSKVMLRTWRDDMGGWHAQEVEHDEGRNVGHGANAHLAVCDYIDQCEEPPAVAEPACYECEIGVCQTCDGPEADETWDHYMARSV